MIYYNYKADLFIYFECKNLLIIF